MIEVGDFVRTDTGKIDKVINNNYYMPQYIVCEKGIVDKENIVKHSKNIIDLIEVGDIVHTRDVLNEDIVYIWSEKFLKALKEDLNSGIELIEILTKEQYMQNCYKIPEKSSGNN